MSYEAVEWAMDKAPMLMTERGRPDSTSRHVLQCLAEFAKSDGTDARPSVERLEHRTGYDRRTVQRALRRLEAAELIVAYGQVNGCTRYRLAVEKERPQSDWDEIEIRAAASKASDAERQRRSRARRVTHSDDVTVTHSDSVTTDQMSRTQSTDVTHSDCVTDRDVTHFDSGCHALSAARTIRNLPSKEEPPENLTGPPHLQTALGDADDRASPPHLRLAPEPEPPLSAMDAIAAAKAVAHAAKHGTTTNTA